MKMNVRLDLDGAKLAGDFRLNGVVVQTFLKNEVARDTEPFVPFKAGFLTKSVRASIGTPEPELIYNTVYAQRLYHGKDFTFRRTVHPQASAEWFEKSKAIYRDIWVKAARKYWKEINK